MKRISVFILTVSSLLLACQKQIDQTSVSKDQEYFNIFKKAMLSYKGSTINRKVELKIANQVTRPFKGSGSGTISYNFGGCGDGTLQVLAGGSDNNGTHFGKFSGLTTRCIDLKTGETIGTIDGVITTANGDLVYYRIVDAGFDPVTGLYWEEHIFTGGTGRFINCSGGDRLVFPELTATTFSYNSSGTITF